MIVDKADPLSTYEISADVPVEPNMDNLAVLSDSRAAVSTSEEVIERSPFFHYRDHSQHVDPDPLYPLVPPGRVPTFPAKIHAILSRSDLHHIISWLPHGRSWQVLKPREFESQVIPQYFEHTRYSSFVRQANGWGFRRIKQGQSQNSYYHPMFLRGLPHLAKTMKRQCSKGQKKGPVDPKHEPDLYKISELYPLPEKAAENSIMLQCMVKGGPKARMPACSRSPLDHKDMAPVVAIQESQLKGEQLVIKSAPEPFSEIRAGPFLNNPTTIHSAEGGFAKETLPLAQVHEPTLFQGEPSMTIMPTPMNSMFMLNHPMHQLLGMVHQPADPNFMTASSSLFAAGFAAAMAQNQQYFNSMLQTNLQAFNNAAGKPESLSTSI